MLLIYPPLAKPGEPPAGIACLAGALRGHDLECTLLDANLEGLFYLLERPCPATDTWSRRACAKLRANIAALKNPELYRNPARYQQAVAEVNRVLEMLGKQHELSLSLANYQDADLSPLKSRDLLQAADQPEQNIFYPYFAERLSRLIEQEQPPLIGISLNYLSQALTTFAMVGFIKQRYPGLPIVLGGGLVTSWLRNPAWRNPFAGLVDHLIAGPGEEPLLALLGKKGVHHPMPPDFAGLPLNDYLAPGLILPYAASTGCYWNRCSFCPEKAEANPYRQLPLPTVLEQLALLKQQTTPALLHLLDNAVSPALMRAMVDTPPGVDWYGFARVSPLLADVEFCHALRRSGCVMLKLGLESGDQQVLDAMDKGIELGLVSRTLDALQQAGIATYVYLLFGTPPESILEARRTMAFAVDHHQAITFLNLAIFNMPLCGLEEPNIRTNNFYEGDLSLYTDFIHPRGWSRQAIRKFLDQEFKRQPEIAKIIQRDPSLFTSNHAAFFC
ncbi:MAG: radical SAM protein [Desulfobulbaceae bacterium]|nr:radical SAM protein [Desulfobulbaceae bacterium]HIJ79232.1 radical SAM protein [Deltaproteobacteria bacterium]